MKQNEDVCESLSQSVSQLALVMAEATLQNDFSYKEFVEYYKKHMVKLAKESKKKATVVEISARTGIDRRFIGPYLSEDSIHVKPSKVEKVFADVLAYCEQNNTKKILKNDDEESFETLCYKHANGSLTPKAIYTELWRLGYMKDVGTHYKLKKPTAAAKKQSKAAKRMEKISQAVNDAVQDLI